MPTNKARMATGCVLAAASLLLSLFVISVTWPDAAGSETEEKVRPAVLAGTWYSDNPVRLQREIDRLLNKTNGEALPGKISALAVPHAGYMYSGPVAAAAYTLLRGLEYEAVILVGPSHRARFDGVSVDLRDYETPLGRVALHRELAQELLDEGGGLIIRHPWAHTDEHCLEIQLPFLQTVLPDTPIVPLLMGRQDMETCRALASILSGLIKDRKILLLATTDLSHYYTGNQARVLDMNLVHRVREYQPEVLHQDMVEGKAEACGGGALVAVMLALQEAYRPRSHILKYANSGDASGDYSRVVGYMSAAFTIPSGIGEFKHLEFGGILTYLSHWLWPPAEAASETPGPELSERDRKFLLHLARDVLECAVDRRDFKWPTDNPASLDINRGVFVTLKKNGRLRGCIGRIDPDKPLYRLVPEMAIQSAYYDHRFPPLASKELKEINIEISVLTALEPVKDVGDIVIGRHGLLIVNGNHSGLLLPQVPLEQGWDRARFLSGLCRKAGLPADAWRDKQTRLFHFGAQVFGEDHPQ